MIEALAQQVQVSAWVLARKACFEAGEALLPGAEATVDAAQQALFKIVDALGLLLQALAGVSQPACQAFEARCLAV